MSIIGNGISNQYNYINLQTNTLMGVSICQTNRQYTIY